MRQEIARHVERGELHAQPVIFDDLEELGGDALGRLSLIVAREHAVDVRVVKRPEALADVHGEVVDRWNDQNLFAGHEPALRLDAAQRVHDLRGDGHLMNLVAAQRADDAGRGLAGAEAVAGHAQIVAVERFERKEHVLFHARTSSRASTRASSEPS